MEPEQRPLGEADLEQMWELEREAFNVDPADRDRWQRWERAAGPERFEGAFVGGRLVAMAGVLGLGQWFGGRPVPMGGLRAVAVRLEHRRRGHAARVVRAALAAMRARGECISALYPQVVRPYRRLGWEIAGTLLYRQVSPRELAGVPEAAVPIRRATQADRAAIRAAYATLARATNGFVDRTEERWSWIFERFADDFWFLAEAAGYLLYRHLDPPGNGPEGFRVLVHDLVATSPQSLHALWTMLGGAASTVPAIVFRSGPVEPLVSLVDGNGVTVVRERPWMLRIVDGPAAIAARGYDHELRANVPLELVDDVCPWNAGRWRLVVEGGVGRLERGGAGTIRLGIGALAALYSGWAPADWLARTGGLEGGGIAERSVLGRVFAGPLPWMMDEF
jgi:predicted acetyltransferase